MYIKATKKDASKDSVIFKKSKTLDAKSAFHNEHFYPISSEVTQGYYAVSPAPKTLGSNNCSVVQRYLIVADKDITREYYDRKKTHAGTVEDDLDRFVTNVAQQMLVQIEQKKVSETDPDTMQYLTYLQDSIISDPGYLLREQLKKWIRDNVGDKSNFHNQTFGQKFQPRVYHNYYDLAVAFIGWVDAKANRRREKKIAHEIMKDKAVNFYLNSVFLRIIQSIRRNSMCNEIQAEIQNPNGGITVHSGYYLRYNFNEWAIYKSYFDKSINMETHLPAHWDVLEHPDKYDIRQKIGVLHDLMHYFGEKFGNRFFFNGLPTFQATTLRGREDYNRPENSQIRGDGTLVRIGGTLLNFATQVKYSSEEQHGSYQYARRKHLPMYGRHSYSAARMMGLAKQTGATLQEISAVSWAIMAYWRIHYDHTNIPYHTTHEIMDFTPAFGLNYDPQNRFAGFDILRKEYFLNFLISNVYSDPRIPQALIFYYNNYLDAVKFFLDHQEMWTIPCVMHYLRTTVLPFDEFWQLPIDRLIAFFSYSEENRQLFENLPPSRKNYINCHPLCKKYYAKLG